VRTRGRTLANLLKGLLLLVGFVGVFAAAGWWLGEVRLLTIFAFCALLAAGAVAFYLDRVVLGITGARELPVGEAPALHALVEGLAGRAGVAKPKLHLLPDGHPRAFATGRGPRSSSLAVSAGLLAAAPPAELEGIVAHELSHIRARDVLIQSIAVVIAMFLVEASRIGGWLERALLFVLGPVAAAFVHLLLSQRRDFAADRDAAAVCGSPHGLADALLRLEQANELIAFEASPATEPLYTINPFAAEGLGALFDTHPPVGERIRRLRELDPDWRQKLRAA
jgi:heat shock protein HtpX